MNPQRVVTVERSIALGGAVLAVILQTFALGGIVWKGAVWSAQVNDWEMRSEERAREFQARATEDRVVLERTVAALAALERRVAVDEARKR